MFDRMMKHGQHTFHGSIYLNKVNQLKEWRGSSSMGRGIFIQHFTEGITKKMKEQVIIPVEQRDFNGWYREIKDSCPEGIHTTAGMMLSKQKSGATPSVSSVVENDGSASDSVPLAIRLPPMQGRVEDRNSDIIGIPGRDPDMGTSCSSQAGLEHEELVDEEDGEGGEEVGGKHDDQGAKDMDEALDYERMSSNDTQPPGVLPQVSLNRVEMAPSAATEQDGELGGEEATTAPGSPESSGSAADARHTARIIREDSATGTDVE